MCADVILVNCMETSRPRTKYWRYTPIIIYVVSLVIGLKLKSYCTCISHIAWQYHKLFNESIPFDQNKYRHQCIPTTFYFSSRSISKRASIPSRKSQYGMINGNLYLLFAIKPCLWRRFSSILTTKWWYTIYISIEHAPFRVNYLIILAHASLAYIELRGRNK